MGEVVHEEAGLEDTVLQDLNRVSNCERTGGIEYAPPTYLAILVYFLDVFEDLGLVAVHPNRRMRLAKSQNRVRQRQNQIMHFGR